MCKNSNIIILLLMKVFDKCSKVVSFFVEFGFRFVENIFYIEQFERESKDLGSLEFFDLQKNLYKNMRSSLI